MEVRTSILERARALQGFPGQTLPEATPHLVERAEQIAGGTAFFYGETPIGIGLRDIDWTGGHVKHQEWPAQLNRFHHLPPLAAAYQKTRDERFAEAARAYIEDWIRSDPGHRAAERCRPGDNTLNISIRLGTSQALGWGGVLPALLASAAFDDAFLTTVLDSISDQAHFLSRHLTPWGNWRISQLDALVFTGLRFPFLQNGPELLEIGTKGMRNALATQFLPDGVHIERTPGYHHWMAQVLADYCELPKRFPEADAHVDPDTVVRALDYSAQSELSGINDASFVAKDPDRLRYLKRRAEALRRLPQGPKASPAPPLAQVFPDAGQAFVRSAWEPGADYLAFDASTWGGGHGHLSRLSFVFRCRGRVLVADPGILSYEMSDPLGPYGKSTPAHSTLNLNGLNQCEGDARLLRSEFTPRAALIQAKYEGGYWAGEYGWSFGQGHQDGLFGSHERVLFWVKGEYLLALDTMDADPGSSVRNCWQLGPMDAWSADPLSLSWWSENEDVNLSLRLVLFPEGAEMECVEGSREPLRGWVGRHGHDAVPAPLVEFRYPSGRAGGSASAVLLAPFSGPERPSYPVRRASESAWGHCHEIEMGLPGGGVDVVGWTKGLSSAVDTGETLVSDASFVWLRLGPEGRPGELFLLDGSYLDYRGARVHEGDRRAACLTRLGSGTTLGDRD